VGRAPCVKGEVGRRSVELVVFWEVGQDKDKHMQQRALLCQQTARSL
jgi:hypothetical protein